MYYILNENIALRSWIYVPYAYLTGNCSTARGVSEEEFEILKQCDGSTDLPETETIKKLLDRELISPCEKGERALTEWQKHIECHNRYLPMLNLQLTGKCNYNCLHCFNCADNAPLQSEMSYEAVIRLLDDCVRCGVTSFTVTGGEPLIHPQFREILAEMYKRRLFIFELNTNGFFVTEDLLDHMISIGCRPIIKISFDGLGYHDWMRNHKGAEQKALAAIRLCREKGFRVKVQTNVNRKNADSVYPTLCMLDEMGIAETRLIKTTDAPRWRQNARGMDLSWPEYYEFIEGLLRKYAREEHSMILDVWQTLYYNPKQHYYNFSASSFRANEPFEDALICRTARSMMAIASDGEVYPCMQMQGFMAEHKISFGNVFRDGLQTALSDGPLLHTACLTVEDRLSSDPACRTCEHLKNCHGGCPALAVLTHGGDYACFLAEDRTKCILLKEGWYERITAAFGEGNRNSCYM